MPDHQKHVKVVKDKIGAASGTKDKIIATVEATCANARAMLAEGMAAIDYLEANAAALADEILKP